MTHHKMDLIRQQNNLYEWECPICERHVRVTPRGAKVLNKGDQEALHSGATQALSLIQRIRRLM